MNLIFLFLIIFFPFNLSALDISKDCPHILTHIAKQGHEIDNDADKFLKEIGINPLGVKRLGGNSSRSVYRIPNDPFLIKTYDNSYQLEGDYYSFMTLEKLLNSNSSKDSFSILKVNRLKTGSHEFLKLEDKPGVDFATYLRDPKIPDTEKSNQLQKWNAAIEDLATRMGQKYADAFLDFRISDFKTGNYRPNILSADIKTGTPSLESAGELEKLMFWIKPDNVLVTPTRSFVIFDPF